MVMLFRPECSMISEKKHICFCQSASTARQLNPFSRPFRCHPPLCSAKANSQNRTTLALSGKVKTAFVTLRFTFFLRYLLQLLFSVLLAAFFAFSFYYDKKGARNEEDHLHVWWFQRPMAWHHSGASWCNEPGQCAASCFRSPLCFPPK